MRERLREHRVNHLALTRENSIPVIRLSEKLLCARIDDHVAGTGVQSNDFARVSEMLTGRDDCQVRYAPDILQNAQSSRMSVEGDVEKRNERSTFAAGSHVGWTKIRN